MLSYNSFNRFNLQFFSKKGTYYDIHSDIITNRGNKLVINYNHLSKSVQLLVNNKVVGVEQLDSPLHNYNSEESIIIGSDSSIENFFKGSIDRLVGNSSKRLVYDYNGDNITDKCWLDTDNLNLFNNIEVIKYTPKEYIGNRIPFRRNSVLKRIKHENNGFINGRWKHDMTRWNQIKFNNDVLNNPQYKPTEGLSSCWYKLNSKEEKGKVIHLNIGL